MNLSTKEIDSFFFDKNPSPMVVFDLNELQILKVNEAAVQKYGYSAEEFEDLNLKAIHAKEEVPILKKHLEGLSKDLQSPYHRHQKKCGDFFYAQVSSRNFFWNETEVQMAVIHDVSKEVESYKQLEEAKKQLNRAQNIAKVGSWLMSFDDMRPHWSDQMYDIIGLSKETTDLSIEKLLEHIPEEDQREFIKYLKGAEAGKIDADGFEHRVITAEGETRYVVERGEVDYDDNGNAVAMRGTMQDITKRKNIGRELYKRSEAMDASIDGIGILGANDEYIYMNKAHASMFGYDSPAELIGKRWHELYNDRDIEFFEEEVFPILQKRGEWRGERKGVRKDGSQFSQELTLSSLEDGGLICIVRDITRRKKNEKRIENSLKEKNVLLAEIHHRVKNNLAVISGFFELQLFSEDNERIRHVLKDNQNRIISMAKIHELLYQSKDFANISFNDYIVQIVEHLSSSHQSGNISFEIENAIHELKLNIDQAIPCALIVNEVVSNAIEHAFVGKNEGVITLKLQQPSEKIKITIEDNGIGLPEGLSLNGGHSSSLGLQLISTLTKQIGGQSGYKGSVGEGSRFGLSFMPQEDVSKMDLLS